ncbi:MAG: LPS export ABC transporter permease LptF [Pseudomonadota bacterium]
MIRILNRHVFAEAAQTWLGVTGVLLFILLSNQFARVLGDAAKDKIPKDAVFGVIGLTALQYLTILVPFAVFLAIMLSQARLYRDSEMPAMMACGVSPTSLYRPLGWLTLPLAILVGYLALVVGPTATQEVERIGAEARRQVDLAAIEPGRFIETGNNGAVVYAERVGEDGALSRVFVQRRLPNGGIELVTARRGTQQLSDDESTRFIVLEDGQRYEGVPGTNDFRLIEFAEHGLPYTLPQVESLDLDTEAQTTAALLQRTDAEALAELQWRVSIPISVLVLTFLAVPLARSQPRQGRYGKMALGILIYVIYFNLLAAARVWVEQGRVPPIVGLWWVHLGVIAIGLALLATHNGWLARLRVWGRST